MLSTRSRIRMTPPEIWALLAGTVVLCGYLYSIKSSLEKGQLEAAARFDKFEQRVAFQYKEIVDSQNSFVKDRDSQRLDWAAWRIKKDERDTVQDSRIQRLEDRGSRSQ